MRTQVAPDAATVRRALPKSADPFARRFRYPFTNCTNCGPRLSIICEAPYDRERTTMAPFDMCDACGRNMRRRATGVSTRSRSPATSVDRRFRL